MKRFLFLISLVFFPSHSAHPAEQQLWLYSSQNLWVDKNVGELEALLDRAGRAGYTHVLLADSKFSKLGEMDARYFRNLERVKRAAAEARIEIVPALFSVGYSNDLLWHDPNLIEALPVQESRWIVHNGKAELIPDPRTTLRSQDFSDLSAWDWKDPTVVADEGTARIRNPGGQNARIVQKVNLVPFRQYHASLRIRTKDFKGTVELKVLAGDRLLNHNNLEVKPSQDWQTHHLVFNSLTYTQANVYLGAWGPESGDAWLDDLVLEESGLVNLVRRPGAPLSIRTDGGRLLNEGDDYERVSDPLMGTQPYNGVYDLWHTPPSLRVKVPDGTQLRVSYYHAATVHDGQAMICPSEPRTSELLRDQAERMHRAWQAKGYFMSHDEIRVLNWCRACQDRKLTAGQLVAANARECINLLRRVNPGGRIYVWSDMFDPHHNARDQYYLVRDTLAGSWEGLDRSVIVVPWYYERRLESLKWFQQRGHPQIIAGYYDARPERILDWIRSALEAGADVQGIMYTTWQRQFGDLEPFAEAVRSGLKIRRN